MKKYKDNLFSSKFRLLNTQEHSEDINWSSSESSEFEDCNSILQQPNRTKKPHCKRKRISKVSGNVSNLDITITDTVKDLSSQKSPVLLSKTKPKTVEKVQDLTYLIEENLETKYSEVPNTSPILCTGQVRANLCMKSPVIAQKFASPANSPKVKKTLFKEHISISNKTNRHNSEPVQSKYFKFDFRNTPEDLDKQIEISTPVQSQNFGETADKIVKSEFSCKKVNVDLIRKVKSFFDNHFNSDNSSQPSIADSLTPKNVSNDDDIEILSVMTQVSSHENSIKSLKHTNSTDNSEIEAEKSKKMRYKKDGLAYRLNAVLKKHNANISLWQHERFLAENSNFKIPKGEHLVFRIQGSIFKFGCFLLEAVDVNDDFFIILVNQIYNLNNCTFKEDVIFKLYEPYQIFNFVDYKLIVNVCKFECDILDV